MDELTAYLDVDDHNAVATFILKLFIASDLENDYEARSELMIHLARRYIKSEAFGDKVLDNFPDQSILAQDGLFMRLFLTLSPTDVLQYGRDLRETYLITSAWRFN